jgi:anti-sigma B factor antagonist
MAAVHPVRVIDDHGCEIVRLRGDIDHSNAGVLERGILAATRASGGVIIDLSAVTFLDSGGLRCLDTVIAAFVYRGAPVRVVAPSGGPVRFTLEVVDYLPELLAESVDEGIAALTE